MLRRLRPDLGITNLDGSSTAFFSRNPLNEEMGVSPLTNKLQLIVFREIKTPPKIFIFDHNNTLTNDKPFQFEYWSTIVRYGKTLFSSHDEKKLKISIKKYGTKECLSSEYNGFFPEDASVCNFEVDSDGKPVIHEIRFPNGTVICDKDVINEYIARRSPPVPFLGKFDQTGIFWLLARRGVEEKVFRKISEAAYRETIANKELIEPGFNSLLGDFFERFNHKKSFMVVATDNSINICSAALERIGIANEIKDIYARADKIHNYPNIIRHLIDKYHVEPMEIVVFGDSYWSDIYPILNSEFSETITVHITGGKNYVETYSKHGPPSLSAYTPDTVFKYLLEAIPERKGKTFILQI
ncbi:MAG: HAD family hydrolase [Candidatus Anstonellales archaeon]